MFDNDDFDDDDIFKVISGSGYFGEADTQNWKSLDTRVPVIIFVKIHKYSRMYKIFNMNTSFSSFIRVTINVDLL